MIDFGGFSLNSIDYILIVDREFTIVYNTRLDKRLNIDFSDEDKKNYINRNLFEVYPTIDKKNSSIVESMRTGEIVVKRSQKFKDFKGILYITNNVTIPIVRKGIIVGALEMTKDIKTIYNVKNENVNMMLSHEDDDISNSIASDDSEFTFDDIITNDKKMLKIIGHAKTMSLSKNPTLIYGETGTGKEVFVQSMINYSGISRKKVVIQNCAALPQNLIESILFGTYRGAYTGAENRKGLFEEADGGIIFLDELSTIPYDVQGKLLRVLQDGSFRPVGSNIEKSVGVKIIAAMNVDPMEAIENKQLRKDLFYRLSGGMIYLPPLRERKNDISLFVDNYIKVYNSMYRKKVQGITDRVEKIFQEYDWEGNIRELRHIIESMVSISQGIELDVEQLPAYMYDRVYRTEENLRLISGEEYKLDGETYNLNRIVKEREIEVIRKVLSITGGNKTKAAGILGIPRQTLKYKIDKYEL